jgi:hypothetical protein
VKLTGTEKNLLQELLRHDGYAVLERKLAEREARLVELIMSPRTDWDETNRARAEYQAAQQWGRKTIERMLEDG